MTTCFFVSDLHGKIDRYKKLFRFIVAERPAVVFLGGDLLPHGLTAAKYNGVLLNDFITDFLFEGFKKLQDELAAAYPKVYIILGNDDPAAEETILLEKGLLGVWQYIHNRNVYLDDYSIFGYACVPPTPFQLKDWERYDVSRYVDPGCISPEEGRHSIPVSLQVLKFGTIQKDLQHLAGKDKLNKAIWLFHSPPYKSNLDRAALDGKKIDHVPLDVHVGSIAVRRFIEKRQPLITLHGHIHESARLTGEWQDRIGKTFCFSAAHDGPELALVRFELENPESATRELI